MSRWRILIATLVTRSLYWAGRHYHRNEVTNFSITAISSLQPCAARPGRSPGSQSGKLHADSFRLGRREKVDEIAIRVAKINRTGSPRLCRRGLDPRFHDSLKSRVFPVGVRHPELQDHASVRRRFSRARDVFLLRLRVEDGQDPRARSEFSVAFAIELRRDSQKQLVEGRERTDIL